MRALLADTSWGCVFSVLEKRSCATPDLEREPASPGAREPGGGGELGAQRLGRWDAGQGRAARPRWPRSAPGEEGPPDPRVRV